MQFSNHQNLFPIIKSMFKSDFGSDKNDFSNYKIISKHALLSPKEVHFAPLSPKERSQEGNHNVFLVPPKGCPTNKDVRRSRRSKVILGHGVDQPKASKIMCHKQDAKGQCINK